MLSVIWWKLVLTKIKTQNQGASPLYIAAINGHLDVVLFLVEVGVDKDQTQNQAATPLYIAAQNGYPCLILYLNNRLHRGFLRTISHSFMPRVSNCVLASPVLLKLRSYVFHHYETSAIHVYSEGRVLVHTW